MEEANGSSNSNPSHFPTEDDADHHEEMNIFVKVMKTIAFKAKGSDTVRSLKARLGTKECVSERILEFYFGGIHLNECRTLAECGIKQNSTLNLFVSSKYMMVYIEILSTGTIIEVKAKMQDTVERVKSLIKAEEGIEPNQYTLMHAGKILEDSKTLASLNVHNGSTLHLVFSPKDVMQISVKGTRGEMVKLEVKLFYTVRDVKAIAASLMGFSVEDQLVFYEGIQLEDNKRLDHYNIKEESTLEILPSVIQIFVKISAGRSITLAVRPSDTPKMVNERVFRKLKLPDEHKSAFLAGDVLFAGKRLEKDRDLASYKINKDATIHIPRLDSLYCQCASWFRENLH